MRIAAEPWGARVRGGRTIRGGVWVGLTRTVFVAIRAIQKPLDLDSLPFCPFAPNTKGDREAMFVGSDFAGAEAGSIRGNCSK